MKIKSPMHIRCGHTTDFYHREIDLPWENLPEFTCANLSWVSILQDQKVTPTFVTRARVNKLQNTQNSKTFLAYKSNPKHACNSMISYFFSHFILICYLFLSMWSAIKSYFSTMFDCQHAQQGPRAMSLANNIVISS